MLTQPCTRRFRRLPNLVPERDRGAHACARLLAVVGAWLAIASANAGPSDGQEFRDWVVRCEPVEPSRREQCFIVQNLVLKETQQRVLIVAVTLREGDGAPAALLTLPLGILLPPGIELRVDGGRRYRFAVERCLSSGCKVGFALDPPLLASFEAGRTAEVVVHDGNGKPVTLQVSLLGFTAGLRALR